MRHAELGIVLRVEKTLDIEFNPEPLGCSARRLWHQLHEPTRASARLHVGGEGALLARNGVSHSLLDVSVDEVEARDASQREGMHVQWIAPLNGRLADRQQRARVAMFGDELSETIKLSWIVQAGREIGTERESDVAITCLV